jgi:NADPH-dependent F420 reductase
METMSGPLSGATIAILGGAGDLGGGLARRWARAGFGIIVGSRDKARAEAAAQEIKEEQGLPNVRGATYEEAAEAATISALAVPFAAQAVVLASVKAALQGKVLVDCTVPLKPPKVAIAQLPDAGSAAQIAQLLLGPGVRVVSAFQNVGAARLREPSATIECDVLVCSDDVEARNLVIALANASGLRGIDAGALANAAAAEALTSVLISINRRYKAHSAGIRITGLEFA